MAAPVHRFAALDPPPRRPRPSRSHRVHGTPAFPQVHTTVMRRSNEEPSLYVEIPASSSPPQPTIAHIAAARSVTPDTLLRTAALGLHQHSPMMAPHLKFGMLVSFALATIFLAGAKYYFDRQVSRDSASGSGEASFICAAIAALAGIGCALSLCRSTKPLPAIPPDRISSTAQRHLPTYNQPARESEPSDDISLGTLLQTVSRPPSPRSEAPPPPYHIAVLLPTRAAGGGEPPAYSALS